jgi:hypothetical protein
MPLSPLDYTHIVFGYKEIKVPSWKEEQDGIYKQSGRFVMYSLPLVQTSLKN